MPQKFCKDYATSRRIAAIQNFHFPVTTVSSYAALPCYNDNTNPLIYFYEICLEYDDATGIGYVAAKMIGRTNTNGTYTAYGPNTTTRMISITIPGYY